MAGRIVAELYTAYFFVTLLRQNNTMYNMNEAIKIIERFSSFILYEAKDSYFSPFNNE